MEGFSINTSVGFIVVLALIQMFLAFYTWYLRKTKGRQEEQLVLYTEALEAQLRKGVSPLSVDFFSEDLSFRAQKRLFREFLRTRCAAAPHPYIQTIRKMSADCGLTEDLRHEASMRTKWGKAVALRLFSVVCEQEDADFFRMVIAKSHFKPAILAAVIGLANCNQHIDLKSFIEKLYNPKTPNRDEVLALLEHYYTDSVDECLELIAYESLPLHLRATLIDFVGVSRVHSARPVLEDLLRDRVEDELALHVAEALEKTGNEKSSELVLPLLKSEDFRVRLKAVNALERLSGEKYLSEAEELLSDENIFVRRNAAEAISRMGEAGIAKLNSISSSSDTDAARTAKMILAEKEFGKVRWRHRYGDSVV